tara:strand:+ start:780 stop:1322 length:543 start_codon:yes stop_codon:yes gene_type:complete
MFAGTLSAQDVVVDNDVIYTDNTNKSSVESTSNSTTTVKSPPPSAIAPSINSANSDLCTVGVSGAVQTQILGISAGKTVRDMNCEKLKNAKVLYDMGMKVAAVSTMCQDPRVFKAMMNAGTPCPYDGLIGDAAKLAWENHKDDQPTEDEAKGILGDMDEDDKSTLLGGATIGGLLLLLLL